MAAVKIGLDFGTHFTKVCVGDSNTDKRNKRYSFRSFKDLDGRLHYVLPSVVQINKNNTLSYGYVDEENAMLIEGLPAKNPPQKPLEPEYRTYKDFPVIIPPDMSQFTGRVVDITSNQDLAIGYVVCVQMKCAEYFKQHFNKNQNWTSAKPGYVKAAIYHLTLSDIKQSTFVNGMIDYKGLVELAVSRSFTDGQAYYQSISHPNTFSKKKKKKFVPNPWLSPLKLALAKQYQDAERRLASADVEKLYDKAMAEYEKKCKQLEKEIEQDKAEVDAYNKGLRLEYEQKLKLWMEYERTKDGPIPAIFRSFKQMVFSEGYEWRFELDPMLVSIWYLCYVFFDLDKDYGTQFLTVCMGTSSGQNNWEKNKQKATRIILTVYDLIENVFNHDKDSFLSATLDELKSVTEIKPFSQLAKEENQISVFPEAFVNLMPLAKQRRFGAGINAVVDIGGGTTDISIFIVGKHGENSNDDDDNDDEVLIFDYVSLPFGVNAIDKEGVDVHYHAVDSEMKRFSARIKKHATSLGVSMREANRIVSKRPIVFAGGGSMRTELRKDDYQGFTDVIHINSTSLDSYLIDDITKLTDNIPLLITSLGLAVCDDKDEAIPLIDYKTLFENVEEAYKESLGESGFKYEHGMTDL